jgi:transposase
LRFIFSGGQINDCTQAEDLLSGVKCKSVIADKGYDSAKILEKIKELKAEAVIPPTKNRVHQREYDKEKYRERNLIERLFNRMKSFRRFATRYEKLSLAFEGFVYFIGIWLWIK